MLKGASQLVLGSLHCGQVIGLPRPLAPLYTVKDPTADKATKLELVNAEVIDI